MEQVRKKMARQYASQKRDFTLVPEEKLLCLDNMVLGIA